MLILAILTLIFPYTYLSSSETEMLLFVLLNNWVQIHPLQITLKGGPEHSEAILLQLCDTPTVIPVIQTVS